MTYDLGRLVGHGLISRIAKSQRYRLTPDGLRICAFVTKLAHRVLDPGLARCGLAVPAGPPLVAVGRMRSVSSGPSSLAVSAYGLVLQKRRIDGRAPRSHRVEVIEPPVEVEVEQRLRVGRASRRPVLQPFLTREGRMIT